MPCLIVLIALIFPRVALVLLFLFTQYLDSAYQTLLWPVLGFIFMPFTTLAYAFAINASGSVAGPYIVLVIVAVLLDIGSLGGSGTQSRRRRH